MRIRVVTGGIDPISEAEADDGTWLGGFCGSVIINGAVWPWLFALYCNFVPRGWWTKPGFVTLAALAAATFVIVAGAVSAWMEQKDVDDQTSKTDGA